MRRFAFTGRVPARRCATLALLGAFALGGCSPEGKNSIKMENKQADVVKNLAPSDPPPKSGARSKGPELKSMKTRGMPQE